MTGNDHHLSEQNNEEKIMMKTMMWLGPIRFSIKAGAYEKFQRTTNYQWGKQEPLGHPLLKHLGQDGPSYQYMRPGDDSINLEGTLYPTYNSGLLHASWMRLMASIGIPLVLMQGTGNVLGTWIIETITENNSEFFSDGTPRKIEFSLTLKRYRGMDLNTFQRGVTAGLTAIGLSASSAADEIN